MLFDSSIQIVSAVLKLGVPCLVLHSAVLSLNDLASLADEVREASEAQTDSDRRARVEQTRLHAQAVRQLVSYLMPRSRGAGFERQVEADE